MILFFAHNSHQEQYFNILKNNLPFEIEVKRVNFRFCNAPKIDLAKKFLEIENKYKNTLLKRIYKSYLKTEAKLIYCYYKKQIKKYNPSLIGIWNGIKYPQNIINLFKNKKIFFENGFLPNTTQADCKGVNFLNSVPRNREFYEKLNYYKNPIPNKLIPRKPYNIQGNILDLSNRKYIFIPFQVNYDSQIIYFSKWIKSMEEFFYLINEISHNFDYDFIIKPHPSDKVSDYSHLKKLSNKNVYFSSNSTEELIKNSQAVITLNSSVGIESLIFNKKVITLADAFYNIEGIVKHANNKEELINILKNIDEWKVDTKLIKNFLGYLYYEYLILDSWKNPTQLHFEKLTNRIKQCLQ